MDLTLCLPGLVLTLFLTLREEMLPLDARTQGSWGSSWGQGRPVLEADTRVSWANSSPSPAKPKSSLGATYVSAVDRGARAESPYWGRKTEPREGSYRERESLGLQREDKGSAETESRGRTWGDASKRGSDGALAL